MEYINLSLKYFDRCFHPPVCITIIDEALQFFDGPYEIFFHCNRVVDVDVGHNLEFFLAVSFVADWTR